MRGSVCTGGYLRSLWFVGGRLPPETLSSANPDQLLVDYKSRASQRKKRDKDGKLTEKAPPPKPKGAGQGEPW